MADTVTAARRFVELLEDRDWDGWTALMTSDVVYDMPQTKERIHGRSRYLDFNRTYPGAWRLTPKVVIADDTHGVVWFEWTLDTEAGRESGEAQAFFEFDDAGLITRVTDFWPEPYDPPARPDGLISPMPS